MGASGGQAALCTADDVAIQREEKSVSVAPRNYKAGLAMSQSKLSEQKMQEIRELAAGWGKVIARRAFGDCDGAPDIDLDDMEQAASLAASALAEGTLEALLEQQARPLAGQQPCPDCGSLCPVGSEDRPLTAKGARITLREPVCHCPACRRDFFPPPGASGAG